jgi:hypothetical protein
MNADTPRLTTNNAGVHHLNSVHGVYFHLEHRELGRALLPIASLNTLTMLGAETVGRAYGGGMLKIEPKEADLLPVPSAALVAAQAGPLHAIRSRVVSALRNGDLPHAVDLVDDVILRSGLGLAASDIEELKLAQHALFSRRKARSKPVFRG